jgi:HAD superfamily phosphoserine phosphatase-like hydrolase
VNELERHRQYGDVLILLSASFDFYVDEIGRRLGFDHVVCTQAEWKDGRMTGNLVGANRHGAEKLRCLKELKAQYGAALVVAYADHTSDFPLLRLADEGILINGTPRAQALAMREGIPCRMWRR